MNNHLYILHLFPTTDNDKVNKVAQQRYDNLMVELETQGIKKYTIIGGFYDQINTKEAIHRGHKLIVHLAKWKGQSNVIIMEDDCCFSSKGAWKYFLSQIPKEYDLFCALYYNAEIGEDNRIIRGMSGTHTLYSVHERFYDFILSQPDDVHCDRNLGQYAHIYKYYFANPMCVYQRGGYSYNLKRSMFYDAYLTDKKLYGVD